MYLTVCAFHFQAHGFEILCSKCRMPSPEPDASVSCNPQWKGFMESLKKNDYFRVSVNGKVKKKRIYRPLSEVLFSFSLLTEVAFLLIILRSNAGRTGGISSLQGTDKICRKLLQTVRRLKIQVRPAAVCVNLQHCVSMRFSGIQVQLWKCSRHLLCLSVLSPGEEVLKLLHSCSPFNLEELKKQESQLPPEDSEWAD